MPADIGAQAHLVDNNALIVLKRERVSSDFFRAAHCQVTTDVLREAAEHPYFAQLKAGAYSLTTAVLEQIRTVMAVVAVGDTRLIDLYGNKGSADPGLVACALDSICCGPRRTLGRRLDHRNQRRRGRGRSGTTRSRDHQTCRTRSPHRREGVCCTRTRTDLKATG